MAAILRAMRNGLARRMLATLAAGALAAFLSTVAWVLVTDLTAKSHEADHLWRLPNAVIGAIFMGGFGVIYGLIGASLLLGLAFALAERTPIGWPHRRTAMAAGGTAGAAFVILAHLPDVQFVYSSDVVLGVWCMRMLLERGPVVAVWASLVPPLAGVVAGLAYNGLAPRPGRGPFRSNLAAEPPSP